jgi:hypothetical protein
MANRLDGYPGSVLRSAAVREMTSSRRLQFGQINSHRIVWMFKSPQHTLPKKVTKKHYGNRTTTGIAEITRNYEVQSAHCRPPIYGGVMHADVGLRWPI